VQEPRFELLAVCPIVDPFARRRDPLTGRNCCRMADNRHDITVAARFGTQHAEAALCIVVGDAFDQACQHFMVGDSGCGFMSMVTSSFCYGQMPLMPIVSGVDGKSDDEMQSVDPEP
jgi:hypothetical protein